MADDSLIQQKKTGETNGFSNEEVETKNDSHQSGCYWWHPRLPCALAYFLACVSFMLGMNIRSLPVQPFNYGNLLPVKMPTDWLDGVIVLMVLWNVHFVRRFTEVLLVHVYHRKMPVYEVIGAQIYYTFFGLWIGWSMNYYFGYDSPPLYLLVPGITLFLIGQVGNCVSHVMLRRLRTTSSRPGQGNLLPKGILFKYVTCPHYLFEIITWMGYSLAAFTFPLFLFLIATFVTLLFRSRKRHLALKQQFDGKDGRERYPPGRKALIPFIF